MIWLLGFAFPVLSFVFCVHLPNEFCCSVHRVAQAIGAPVPFQGNSKLDSKFETGGSRPDDEVLERSELCVCTPWPCKHAEMRTAHINAVRHFRMCGSNHRVIGQTFFFYIKTANIWEACLLFRSLIGLDGWSHSTRIVLGRARGPPGWLLVAG